MNRLRNLFAGTFFTAAGSVLPLICCSSITLPGFMVYSGRRSLAHLPRAFLP